MPQCRLVGGTCRNTRFQICSSEEICHVGNTFLTKVTVCACLLPFVSSRLKECRVARVDRNFLLCIFCKPRQTPHLMPHYPESGGKATCNLFCEECSSTACRCLSSLCVVKAMDGTSNVRGRSERLRCCPHPLPCAGYKDSKTVRTSPGNRHNNRSAQQRVRPGTYLQQAVCLNADCSQSMGTSGSP